MNYLSNFLKAKLNGALLQNNNVTPLRPIRDYTVENQLHSKFPQVPDKSRGYNASLPQAISNLKFLLKR
jgi:hypothetical protein